LAQGPRRSSWVHLCLAEPLKTMKYRHQQIISGHRRSRHAILLLIMLLVIVPGGVLSALGLPGLSMEHLPDLLFTPQQQLILGIRLDDVLGIVAARCYFRYHPAADYVYVDLDHPGGRNYVAALPAPGEAVEEIEYFFLAVNGARQVVRSPSYILQRDPSFSVGSKSPAGQGAIEVHTEGVVPDAFARSLADPEAIQRVPTPEGERYGLIAGVTPAAELPGEGFGTGYFGGFRLDAQGKPQAVRGLSQLLRTGTNGPSSSGATGGVDQGGSSIVGPHVAGKWTGVIYQMDEETGRRTRPAPLTAVVTQDGSDVTVLTDLVPTRPKRLVGSMDDLGNMLLYDEINEDWSTHFGPASMTQMTLADYIEPPTDENRHPPLLVVELWRDPPYVFLQAVYDLLLHKVPK
jgi:hypothetical protein